MLDKIVFGGLADLTIVKIYQEGPVNYLTEGQYKLSITLSYIKVWAHTKKLVTPLW